MRQFQASITYLQDHYKTALDRAVRYARGLDRSKTTIVKEDVRVEFVEEQSLRRFTVGRSG